MTKLVRTKTGPSPWVTEVEPQGGGGSGLSVSRTELSSAELLALNSNPVELVAAPGAGFALLVVMAVLEVVKGTTVYGSVTPVLRYASPLGITNTQWSDALTADPTLFAPVNPTFSCLDSDVEDQAIQMWADSDPVDGDGTAVVTVYYVTVELL